MSSMASSPSCLMSPRLVIRHWLEHQECIIRITQWTYSVSPYQPDSSLLICLPWRSQISFQLFIVIPYDVNQIAFNGFSTLIAELFSSWIWDWSHWGTKICNINENRSETVLPLWSRSLCELWYSKFCTQPFERCHSYYLFAWTLGRLREWIRSGFLLSQKE